MQALQPEESRANQRLNGLMETSLTLIGSATGSAFVGGVLLAPAIHSEDYALYVHSNEQLTAIGKDRAALDRAKSGLGPTDYSQLEAKVATGETQVATLEQARLPFDHDTQETAGASVLVGLALGTLAVGTKYVYRKWAKGRSNA